MKILNLIIRLLTIIIIVVFFLTSIAQYIDPNKFGYLAILSLGMPITIIVYVLLTAYWIVLWDKLAVVMLSLLIIFSGSVSRHFKIKITKDLPYEKQDLRVLTYNVGVFHLMGKEKRNSTDSILTFINNQKPDIVFLQEFITTKSRPLSSINSSLRRFPYHYVIYFSKGEKKSSRYGIGLAIYSRYRLKNGNNIRFNNGGNGVIYADMIKGRDTTRIINVHLQTSTVQSREVYEVNETEDAELAKSIVRKLMTNNNKRAIQAQKIAKIIAESPYKVILCGDFNDTPSSYTYHTVNKGLTDAFRERGKGLGFTYNSMFNLLRIDNVFTTKKEFEILNYTSPQVPYSDHNPIIVDMNYKK